MATTKSTRETTVEGPSTTVKTTTTSYSSSYESEDGPTYRSLMNPRQTMVYRSSMSTPYGRGGGGGQMMSRQQASYNYSMPAAPAGAYQNMTNTGVSTVMTNREREKKDMQDLNERFASYIEKVRFLEAQNRKLADELDKLKSRWGKETQAVKAMYQAELDEARKLLDDAEKEKARLEIRVSSLEEEIQELRNK